MTATYSDFVQSLKANATKTMDSCRTPLVPFPSIITVSAALLFLFSPSPSLSQTQTQKIPEFSFPVRIVPDLTAGEDEKQQRHADEDLEAQRRSAFAAERASAAAEAQVCIGWLQLLVSVIGTIGLVVTLVLTRASTKAAADAAKAALNANTVARENFDLDQRPWIKLERPQLQLAEHCGTFAIQFSVEAINVGKTPARAAELHLEIAFGEIMTPSVEGVEAYAQMVAKPGTWRNSEKIVFPNASRPMEDAEILDAPPDPESSCRIRYCVNYRGSSANIIYHTAGEVTFPMSRLMSASRSDKSTWKYNFYGTSSVA